MVKALVERWWRWSRRTRNKGKTKDEIWFGVRGYVVAWYGRRQRKIEVNDLLGSVQEILSGF